MNSVSKKYSGYRPVKIPITVAVGNGKEQTIVWAELSSSAAIDALNAINNILKEYGDNEL